MTEAVGSKSWKKSNMETSEYEQIKLESESKLLSHFKHNTNYALFFNSSLFKAQD